MPVSYTHLDVYKRQIDRSYFLPYPHIHAKAVPEALRSLQRQLVPIHDHTAHIIRQAAVGIGHMAAALDHDDLRVFIQRADAGGGRSTARHTAYDHKMCIRERYQTQISRRWPGDGWG